MICYDQFHISGSDKSKDIQCAPTIHPALVLRDRPREEWPLSDHTGKDKHGADLSPGWRQVRWSPAQISHGAVALWAYSAGVRASCNHGVELATADS